MNLQPPPVPNPDRLRARFSPLTAFGVIGGPLAWFIQLLAGYAMASGSCFLHDQRLITPGRSFAWTHAGMVAVLLLCTLVALAAFWVSWQHLLRPSDRISAGAGRARFIATWGVVLGAGFCVATLLTGVGIRLLPRCAG